jgi:hypothetical protein
MQYVISTGAVAHLDYDDRMESACDRMMPVFLSSLMCWQRAAAVLEVYLSAELSAASRRGAGSYIVLLALWLARVAPLHFAWRVLHEHEHQIEAQNIEIVTLHY